MLKTVTWNALNASERQALLARPSDASEAMDVARDILSDLKQRGETAVRSYAERLDQWNPSSFKLPVSALKAAANDLDTSDRQAILSAYEAIIRFHREQGLRSYEVETWGTGRAERRVTPIQTAGLYVPSGTAPLVSTLLMLAAPAQIANVPHIAVLVPPIKGKGVEPTVLAAASLIGIENVYAIGGAHGVGALGYGLAGLPKADKIFGPGNAYVAAAKTLLAQDPAGCACDLPAGPSEVMVIADETADPELVAIDLLSQAEHDTQAQVMLVTYSEDMVSAVNAAIGEQIKQLPRAEIARAALNESRAILVGTDAEAINVANAYGSEHLIIQTAHPRALSEHIISAGSIFLGAWTPEAAGDYAAGPNHALPTSGAARAFGGVTVEMFQKTTTVLELDKQSAGAIAPTVESLAALEGLDAHRLAMAMRRERAETGT